MHINPTPAIGSKLVPSHRLGERARLDLLLALVADALLDVGAASSDINVGEASYVRLRRAQDRLAVTSSLLTSLLKTAPGPEIHTTMRESVELLARDWPQDYPAGSLEWILVEQYLSVGGRPTDRRIAPSTPPNGRLPSVTGAKLE
ncbi:hypothetical protein [Paraburkholderia bannensis]|uniref:hypothetical protein n=1 Tax=Paraburkholderia bannensis TaxID=765414 RepID=UPI002AC3540E|nr:hypothetical protein [Paraburkholderia bannensis]